ncbi:translation initiation factor eIF-2B beta subunit [Jimgerdemannia flammicorona]|uniref:Translation initiation factor eIF2B subunit beta n=1 Tax=Jimgerdemannia flammicorona TaxID=994334 RepID=A0A433QEU1_9FUNG|nr:translation initiation factor eIF-2B beta subunit [Jimgerdemannia flammicorona]
MTVPKNLDAQIENFISRLKRRQIIGSYEVAKETAQILRQAVSTTRWSQASTLLSVIKDVGRRLVAAQPREQAVGNIVRRVLKIIRETIRETDLSEDVEYAPAAAEEDSNDEFGFDEDDAEVIPAVPKETRDNNGDNDETTRRRQLTESSSVFNLLGDQSAATEVDYTKLIQEEIMSDLEVIYKGISDQALDHIHSNEVIMTIGKSRTVEAFLKKAAHKRKFQVFVAETSPTYQGHGMAASLASAGIDTTVITDSAIYAIMARVNKVILGAHAVLANGGLVAVGGTQMVAAAAKHHATPVLVCTALYKLSPLYPYDEDYFNVCVAPDPVLAFDEGNLIDKVMVTNTYYDYVAPDMVNLFVHNLLINDNYDPEDAVL